VSVPIIYMGQPPGEPDISSPLAFAEGLFIFFINISQKKMDF